MDNIESNKRIAILIVELVSKMYKLGDGVLVEFEPSSKFPNKEVTAKTTRDYRIIFNIDRLSICPESEVYVTAFHYPHSLNYTSILPFTNKLVIYKYCQKL